MGSFKSFDGGLHEAMITKDEYEIISRIAEGKKAKFKINRNNPDFPANRLICEDFYIVRGIKQGLFTGYQHHNGKKPDQRKYYKRYHCRNCHKAFHRDKLHEMITDYLDKVQLSSKFRSELIKNLRKAWSEVEKDSLNKAAQLKAKIKLLEEQKGRLVMSLADNPEIKADIQEQIIFKKEEISLIHEELEKTLDIESDFNEFVEFSLRTVENWKSEWWELDSEDRERCEQLLFPQLLRVNHNNKVSTPEISAIYRYAPTKKESRKTLSYSYGGPGET